MEFSSKQIEDLNVIVTEFESYRKKIIAIDYIHNKMEFFDIMKEFRKYLASQDDDMYIVFYHSQYYKFFKEFFTDIHEYYLRSIEAIQSLSVMTRGVHNFDSFAEIIDKEIIRESFDRKDQEFNSIDFSNAKKFVFAGCGPFPETILYISENIKIDKILGLDFNHEAIYMAGEMINGLGIENISFKQIDSTLYDYNDADIISIPLFVPKKAEIVNRIIETSTVPVQILIRSPKGFLNMIYKGLGNKITPRAKITYRKDISSSHVNEEIIKIEKYDF